MLVFIHGMSFHTDVWKPFINFFSDKGFKCKAVELRKDRDLRKTVFDDYVESVREIVSLEDIVIGHSMGGLIAQKVAEYGVVKAVISICPAPPRNIGSVSSIPLYAILRYIPGVLINKPIKLSYAFYRKYLANCLDEEKARESYESSDAESAKVTMELGLRRISVDPKGVSSPILFLAAREDRVSPPDIVRKVAELYEAEFKILDGCHYIFYEWQGFAEAILDFMDKHNIV